MVLTEVGICALTQRNIVGLAGLGVGELVRVGNRSAHNHSNMDSIDFLPVLILCPFK